MAKAIDYSTVIIGAGPAGLTAAFELAKGGKSALVLEADERYVGGISRTVEYKGFRFDIGGHRFFSKSQRVEDFWTQMLGDEMLDRPRLSRIYYNGKFFSYPLKPLEAFRKLGPVTSVLCGLSYAKAKAFPNKDPRSFEDWVTNQFGERLYRTFFKTYTEKVWGMNCKEISKDWAAQRIKGLSLGSAVLNSIKKPKPKDRKDVIKTLIDTFRYPRLGPGMMWERCAERFQELGGTLTMGARVVGLEHDPVTETWTTSYRLAKTGEVRRVRSQHVMSTAPIREIVQMLEPAVSPESLKAAEALRYRDFITVAIILKDRELFDDNWVYIHDPGVKVGRVQNFKSWSPEMVPTPGLTCYGLEYFCNEGDGLWASTDEALIALATEEIQKVHLASAGDVVDGCVVRQAKAYPVYDKTYEANVSAVRKELDAKFAGLHLVGRNGMHKYNNQDHAMMTAMLTAENIMAGETVYDVWKVNEDADYHETGRRKRASWIDGLRAVPKRRDSFVPRSS